MDLINTPFCTSLVGKKKLYTSKVYLMHGQIKNVQTRRSKNDKK